MNFKKKVGGSWTDIPHYIMGTSTDTITTLPAVIYPNATTATVGLKGQTTQSSIPSPTSPVMPQGCGNKTANLLYASSTGTTTAPLVISYTNNSAEFTLNKESTSANVSAAVLCDITLDAGTYSIKVQGLNSAGTNLDRVYLVDSNNNVVVNNVINNTAAQFTLAETTTIAKIAFVAAAASTYNNQLVKIMLNTGSTALPYEPFGVKIPILSNSTTTPVYLGEVQSTRLIKKIIFTGSEDENWSGQAAGGGTTRFRYTLANSVQADTAHLTSICTHLPLGVEGGTWNTDNIYTISSNYLWVRLDSSFTTAVSLKSWLAQQYANGTPFTVYYTLATPTTGIVNEPLRKIGDYADEVSGISIPTIAGANTLSVDTTLQPSEVSVNYKGWHTGAVHERDSGQWD